MNENSSSNSSTSAHHGLTAEAISRRAYELWEREGRPENRDLHHWLRAEQELLAERNPTQGQSSSARPQNTDTQPLQGTRAAAAANRDAKPTGKRSNPPFNGDKQPPASRSTQPGMRTAGRS